MEERLAEDLREWRDTYHAAHCNHYTTPQMAVMSDKVADKIASSGVAILRAQKLDAAFLKRLASWDLAKPPMVEGALKVVRKWAQEVTKKTPHRTGGRPKKKQRAGPGGKTPGTPKPTHREPASQTSTPSASPSKPKIPRILASSSQAASRQPLGPSNGPSRVATSRPTQPRPSQRPPARPQPKPRLPSLDPQPASQPDVFSSPPSNNARPSGLIAATQRSPMSFASSQATLVNGSQSSQATQSQSMSYAMATVRGSPAKQKTTVSASLSLKQRAPAPTPTTNSQSAASMAAPKRPTQASQGHWYQGTPYPELLQYQQQQQLQYQQQYQQWVNQWQHLQQLQAAAAPPNINPSTVSNTSTAGPSKPSGSSSHTQAPQNHHHR